MHHLYLCSVCRTVFLFFLSFSLFLSLFLFFSWATHCSIFCSSIFFSCHIMSIHCIYYLLFFITFIFILLFTRISYFLAVMAPQISRKSINFKSHYVHAHGIWARSSRTGVAWPPYDDEEPRDVSIHFTAADGPQCSHHSQSISCSRGSSDGASLCAGRVEVINSCLISYICSFSSSLLIAIAVCIRILISPSITASSFSFPYPFPNQNGIPYIPILDPMPCVHQF